MSSKSSKKSKSERLCRVLLWYPSLGRYMFGHCYYRLYMISDIIETLYRDHGIIAVVYPL